MGGGYGGLESYLRYLDERERLEQLSIDDLYKMLVESSNLCRGGDTMEAIVKREVKESRIIGDVLQEKIVAELCKYTAMDTDVYANQTIEQLMNELSIQRVKHLAT